MKKFSKILSVALLVALVLSLGVASAFAEDQTPADTAPQGRENGAPLTNKTIELTNPTAGHTYVLYQIFTGTFAREDGAEMLGNIAWGTGITDAGKTALYTKYNLTGDNQTAEKVAGAIGTAAADAKAFADAIGTNVQNGSEKKADDENPAALKWTGLTEGYYIIKDETVLTDGESADAVVVQVLDDVVITAKGGTTIFDKQVADRNDSTQAPNVYDQWGNTSDYDVGDDVPYQVTITLPGNFSSYDTYTMTVKDKMDAGLQFNSDSVVVKIGENVVPATTTGENETTITNYSVVTTGLSNNETFEVRFPNVKAISGAGDNVTFTVTYSAKLTGENVVYGNPGNKNEAWLTYSNNPGTNQTGDSVHKTTVTFTYKLEVDKTDGTNPLPGAEFALKKLVMAENGTTSWTTLALIKNTAGTVFTFDGLDDGRYMIEETATPTGYNSIDPIYFVVEATHSDSLTKLVVKETDKDGVDITGTATAQFNVTLTKSSDEANDAGLIKTEVVNNKGAVLPSTGGIGTTIFYVVGGVLVLAAIILLVTKKRMSE